MKNNINLCIVAGTHGDEYGFGLQVQNQVESAIPRGAYMLTGNPLAMARETRFVDSDLNRSFDGSGLDYEAERVEQIREIFRQEGFTHVVDLHTSPTTHSIVPILPSLCVGPNADEVINANPAITSIVKLPDEDKPYSLVADFGQGGIALECPRYAEAENAARVARGLVALMQGKNMPPIARDIYQAVGLIAIDIQLPTAKMDDFKELPEEIGGISFVADPAIYKVLGYGHQGMKVKHKEVVEI